MDILSLQNWEVIAHEENGSRHLIRADYNAARIRCSYCMAPAECLYKHDKRPKTIKDFPIRGKAVLIKLYVQRFRCLSCNKIFTQKVDQIADGIKITKRFAEYIVKECAEKSSSTVSRDTGVNVSTLREIFVKYMENNEDKMTFILPRILGVDGVYIQKKDRFVLTDIEHKKFIGLFEKTRGYEVERFLRNLPNTENVEIVTMDMSRAFRNAAERVFPKAKIVIDKYHVQKMGKNVIDDFLKSTKKLNIKKSQNDYSKNRFLLYTRSYNLSKPGKIQLKKWEKDVPGLLVVYNLKEEFMNIWLCNSREKAEKAYEKWKNNIPSHLKFAFKKILTAFKNWREQIFNYFDYSVTNAFTESTNRQIKMMQKLGHGCRFWTVRAKMLCRAYFKLTENEKPLPVHSNSYSYIKPKKNQKTLRLKQSYEHQSEVFALMFPKEEGWIKRFKPYLPHFM